MLDRLNRHVRPDAVIVQDLALAQLVRQTGFAGEVHWSTFPTWATGGAAPGRSSCRSTASSCRELTWTRSRPRRPPAPGLNLEVFIHGALCYGVSALLLEQFPGGKAAARRCVQPCRRFTSRAARAAGFSPASTEHRRARQGADGIPKSGVEDRGRKKGRTTCITSSRLPPAADTAATRRPKRTPAFPLPRAGRPAPTITSSPAAAEPGERRRADRSGLLLGRVKGAAGSFFSTRRWSFCRRPAARRYEDAPGTASSASAGRFRRRSVFAAAGGGGVPKARRFS